MKYQKDKKITETKEEKMMKIGKIFIIPAIVAILIIVIIIAGRAGKKSSSEPSAATAQETGEMTAAVADTGAAIEGTESSSAEVQSAASDNKSYKNDFTGYGLQKDAVPEIRELVTKYQRAKVTGDAQLMYEVFGRTDTEGFEEMQAKLEEEKSVYESYEDTVCYTTPGLEDGSYIVYISSRLKFTGIDTPAPMLTWAYVVKNQDGSYVMLEPDKLSQEQQEAVMKVSASEDVALLDKEMRQELAQAVVGDPHLAKLYQTWSEEGAAESETSDDVITENGQIIIHDQTEKETEETSETLEEVEVVIGD